MTQPVQPVVLLVEDDPDARDMYLTALRFAGYAVQTASDGLHALEVLEGSTPALVVLDLMLPRISGYELLDELAAKAATRGVPVIVVTATGDNPAHPNVKCRLQKPVTPDAVLFAVERCLKES